MPKTKEVQRSFRLDPQLDAKLQAKAKKLDRSVSWVIVRCLEIELLGKSEAQQRALLRGAINPRSGGRT